MAPIEEITGWLALQAGKKVYEGSIQLLYRNLGLVSDEQIDACSLDKYLSALHEELQRIRDRIDEDRLAELYSGFSQLKEAPKTIAKNTYLTQALDRFHKIAAIPELGRTGRFFNKELKCLAFLGMASAHSLLGDSDKLVMEKLVSAVLESGVTAKEFIGVHALSISQKFEVTLPFDSSLIEAFIQKIDNMSILSTAKNGQILVYLPVGSSLPFMGGGGHFKTITSKQGMTGPEISTVKLNKERCYSAGDEEFPEIKSFSLSLDGSTLAIGGWLDGRSFGDCGYVKILDMTKGQEVFTKVGGNSIESLSLSPNGDIIAIGTNFHGSTLFDWKSGRDILHIEDQKATITSTIVAFSPDGENIAIASYHSKVWGDSYSMVKVFNWHNGRELWTSKTSDMVASLVFNTDGQVLAAAGGGVNIWDMTGREISKLNITTDRVVPIAFSPDEQILAVGNMREIQLWNWRSSRKIRTLSHDDDDIHWVSSLEFIEHGRLLLHSGGSTWIWGPK